jgi:hypothetical protein
MSAMKKNRMVRYLSALCVAAGSLPAQDLDTLLDNTNQMQVNIALDRTVYFPGEAAVVTFTVRNPTSGPVRVLAPFTAATGCLNMLTLSDRGPALLGSERLCSGPYDSTTPTTVIPAFQRMQKTLNSYDPMFELGVSVMDIGGGVPADSGPYSVEFNYPGSGGLAAFQVVSPHLDASAVARVQDISYYDPVLGETVQTEAYMHAVALPWMNQTWICITQEPGSTETAVSPDAQGNFNDRILPYLRVAGSKNPVTSMALTSDSSGNLTVKWTDSTGAQHTLAVGTAPTPPAPGPVQIGLSPPWVQMPISDTQQFIATVFGDAACATCTVDQSANWSVALGPDASAGSATGTITSSGYYSAPTLIEGSYTVVVTAQSQLDPTKSAIAIVALGPSRL